MYSSSTTSSGTSAISAGAALEQSMLDEVGEADENLEKMMHRNGEEEDVVVQKVALVVAGAVVSREEAVYRWWQGIFFVVVSFVFLLLFLYAALISKLLPPSHNAFLSAIQNDWYYCLLVPLTLPILYVALYFHWLSMKLFKHA